MICYQNLSIMVKVGGFLAAAEALLKSVLRIHDIWVDPDPRIHASDWWIRIRIRIRILLFSSLTFKMLASKKINFNTIFSANYFLKLHLHHFSKIKVKKSHKIVGIKVFLTIFAWWYKDPDPDPEQDPDQDPYLWLVDPDPGDPKTVKNMWIRIRIRIRIRNTGGNAMSKHIFLMSCLNRFRST